MSKEAATATLWGHRDFMTLWGGQTVSVFGSMVGRMVLPFFVIYTLHATAEQVAWVRVCEIVPGMLAGLFAGVWLDRLRRKPVMLLSDVFRALSFGLIPLSFLSGHVSYWLVLAVVCLTSILTVCFDVGYESYVPTLVPEHQLVEANSKISATASIAEVSGFGIAGMLFQWLGGPLAIALDALSFLWSSASLFLIRFQEPKSVERLESEPVFREAIQGFRTIRTNRILSILLGVALLGAAYNGMVGTLYVLYISTNLHVPPNLQGWLYAIGGISSFVGAALSERFLRRLGLGKTLVVTALCGVVGISFVPFAAGPLWLVIGCIVLQQILSDGPDTMYEIYVTTVRQQTTPSSMLARVNATWRVTTWAAMLFGTIAAGWIGEWIGLRTTFFIAIGIRLLSWLLLTGSPVRRVRSAICE